MSIFSKSETEELVSLFKSELDLDISGKEACRNAEQFLNLLVATYKKEPSSSSNSPP
ncbi:MAG: hypothetical protein WC819_04130 [Parcubacteria group bacterium]|jgi:hypothetical protein